MFQAGHRNLESENWKKKCFVESKELQEAKAERRGNFRKGIIEVRKVKTRRKEIFRQRHETVMERK